MTVVVAVEVVMAAVVKVLVWAAATVEMVVGMADVPSGVAVDWSMDALANAMLDVLSGTGTEVLSDANANAFAVVVTALEFPVSTTLEGFSC